MHRLATILHITDDDDGYGRNLQHCTNSATISMVG